MNLPRRRRSRPRGDARLALADDFPDTDRDITEALPRADWDGATFGLPVPPGTTPFSGVAAPLPAGVVPAAVRPAGYDATTITFGGASDPGQPDGAVDYDTSYDATGWNTEDPPAPPRTEPAARLRAQPRYRPPQQPPPAGYSATTGPMPAIGRLTPAIGDALTRDETWGPKLAPLPCGYCGTAPPVPDGILERTRIIGHVNWLAAQAGWKYDVDLILTCPPCQQGGGWKARQGQLEVQGPDSGWYCDRHDADDPDAWCACPGTRLAVDVMLTSHDYLRTGRAISLQILRDTQAGGR
ncbi:MAG TPA: hypothetical protein VGL33_30545 [Streptosporangiaceae bacterium]|jgi:hypothetical protein